MLVREHFPEMPIHLSVQANAVNWATVKFWQQMGLTRVILSRELSLEEIEDIRNQVPIWRSRSSFTAPLCMAYSGRCPALWLYQQARPEPGHLQTPAAGSTTSRREEDDVGNIVHKSTSRFRCKMLSRRCIGAPTDKVFMIEECPASGRVYDRV